MQQPFYGEKVSNTSAESLCADGDSQSEHCPCDLQETDHESPAFGRSAFSGAPSALRFNRGDGRVGKGLKSCYEIRTRQ